MDEKISINLLNPVFFRKKLSHVHLKNSELNTVCPPKNVYNESVLQIKAVATPGN